MNSDYPISQLRLVILTFAHKDKVTGKRIVSPHQTNNLCHESQVDQFIKASIKLHHGPGNPHTGERLDNLWVIYIASLKEPEVFWWSTESLKQNPNGAKLHRLDEERVWAHPDVLKLEKEAEELED